MTTRKKPKRFISAIFPIINFGLDKKIELSTLLNGTGLNEKHLIDANTIISLEQELRVIQNFSEQFSNPEMAWELGNYYQAKAQGMVGNLILNAPTLGEAFKVMMEYVPLSYTFFRFYTETTPNVIRVYPTEIDLPTSMLPFLTEKDMAAVLAGIEDIYPGKKNKILRMISFSHAPRTDLSKYREVLFENIKFNQPSNFFEIYKSALSLPLPGSDGQAFELFHQQCQAEYLLRGGKSIQMAYKVRLCIQAKKGNVTLAEVSEQLRMNEKALGRQLQNEGTSFRKIKQEYFLDQTLTYLKDQSLSIGEIAELMGYSETCAFTRAFQRQVGVTPSQCRKEIWNDPRQLRGQA